MKLETRTNLTYKQTQTFTQKQQYALHILSMNNQQLQSEIRKAIEENPLLEIEEDSYCSSSSEDIYEKACAICYQEKSLFDLLEEQLRYYEDEIPYNLGLYLIDSLDCNGYLHIDNEEVLTLFSITEDTLEDVIERMQTFEPYGVFSRNLQECLLIQLSMQNPLPKVAIEIVNQHLDDLAKGKWNSICKHLSLQKDVLQDAVSLIRNLNPKPTASYFNNTEYLTPEAKISIEHNTIKVTFLENNFSPRITSLSNSYEEALYFKDYYKSANLLISSIEKRTSTLHSVISCICSFQNDYFLKDALMKPCNLKDIAKELNVHESTISRAISNKSIEFQNRYISLKQFFPTKLENGQSNTSIISRIAELIKQESPCNPYSDQKLTELLQQEGIKSSRRAITKYREILKIPTSKLRKQI